MSLTLSDHFCSCSVAALNNVSQQSPEECIRQYIKNYLTKALYSSHCKKYVDNIHFDYYIHIFFSGPRHEGWTLNRDHHFSEKGSCDQLAAYIREHNLGPVVETEGRWNHRHSDRAKGQGDVVCYVWSPDPKALEKWWIERNPPKQEEPKP